MSRKKNKKTSVLQDIAKMLTIVKGETNKPSKWLFMSVNLNHSNILFTEGNTQFYVPKNSINNSPPPRNPAFFNTLAKFKRDILITLLNTYASTSDTKLTFADVLSSVGATGIRLANESNYIKKIYFNDANPIAIEFLNKSLKKNKLNSISEVSTK